MKPKRSTPSKPKLSFTVDRSEFDINSDWVQAVMAPPSLPAREGPFFSPHINNATEADQATGAKPVPVPEIEPVSETVPVSQDAPDEVKALAVAEKVPGVYNTSVVNSATEAVNGPAIHPSSEQQSAAVGFYASVVDNTSGANNTPVDNTATAINSATVPNNVSRSWKLRPLRRITDGLTPGQYAVYSLMLGSCQFSPGGEQLYRGGYADLGRLTGLSKRGIQNVIGELQDKAVIHLHTAPGHHRMQTSAYLVPRPETVLQTWYARGWRFAVGKSKKLTDGTAVDRKS